jgi:hypothetical protein
VVVVTGVVSSCLQSYQAPTYLIATPEPRYRPGILQELASGGFGPLVIYATTRTGTLPGDIITSPSHSHVQVLPAQLSLRDPDSIDALAVADVLINNEDVYHYREAISAA